MMIQVTVEAGDSLWKLAARHLGSPRRWVEIWQLNRAAITAEQRRRRCRRMLGPDWIFPGMTLQVPKEGSNG